MSGFFQSLAELLPKGFAWPRDPRSTLMAVVKGIADAFEELHAVTHFTAAQWVPHQTNTRLAEWEEACGLPDACLGPGQSEEVRRTMLVRRLRGLVLPLEDSAACAPSAIEAICAEMGYSATVRYYVPFRVGRDHVGHTLGRLDGRLRIVVSTDSTPMRVGIGRVGRRLVERVGTGPELECHLRRVLPARFDIDVIYT